MIEAYKIIVKDKDEYFQMNFDMPKSQYEYDYGMTLPYSYKKIVEKYHPDWDNYQLYDIPSGEILGGSSR